MNGKTKVPADWAVITREKMMRMATSWNLDDAIFFSSLCSFVMQDNQLENLWLDNSDRFLAFYT